MLSGGDMDQNLESLMKLLILQPDQMEPSMYQIRGITGFRLFQKMELFYSHGENGTRIIEY